MISITFIVGQYDAHLSRQAADLKAFAEDESLLLDSKLEYSTIPGLSGEVIEKLYRVKPTTMVSVLLCLVIAILIRHATLRALQRGWKV